MPPPFQREPGKRDVYFLEDDHCQQEILPLGAADFCNAELKKLNAFAEAHRAPGGYGWTAVYVREEPPPVELFALGFKLPDLAAVITPILPAFEVVYWGDVGHWSKCKSTAAWGKSRDCALFAEWNDEGIVQSIWTSFFENDEESIRAAAKAVTALNKLRPLVYVDWAWGYTCDAADEDNFASRLRSKVETIAERLRKP